MISRYLTPIQDALLFREAGIPLGDADAIDRGNSRLKRRLVDS